MFENIKKGIKNLSIKAFNLIAGCCILELMIWVFGILVVCYMIL